ncbi:MAG TPA: MiaB/RimO family radical SAM methylthiotransferase [Planctomycetota bacterium]|nr:MiaB/RimO family radical SAM methylthiotransferase [Planctomycetota bacterium]
MTAAATAGRTPRLHLVTFGCQMNRYDSELVAERFAARGWAATDVPDDADVIAFNTCSVRAHAEDRVYGRLGDAKRLKRQRPGLVVAVLGCQAQREGAELLKRAPHVDLVVGTREFPRLPELVERVRRGEGPIVATGEDAEVRVERAARAERGPSAFVAVMRGCDLHCSFCIVPTTRGRVRSRSVEDVLDEVRWLVADGVREIVLLGQTVNAYGYDLTSPTEAEAMGYRRVLADGGSAVPEYAAVAPSEEVPRLARLIRRLGAIPGLDRIRLVTNHVAYLDDALIEALAEVPAAMPFLPLPAQSGSDRILRAMRRGYTKDLYRRRIDRLRARVPGIELSSDWIVGYPGETDAEFEQSVALLREIGFAQTFVFRYSPRPATAAHDEPTLPEDVVAARNAALLRAAEDVQAARWRRYVGTSRPVLVERVDRSGRLVGRTPESLEVAFPGDASLVGEIVDVEIDSAGSFGARGTRAR